MGADSKIEWTDHTFNPWIGCTKVSPGCDNCYAEKLDARFGNDAWGPHAERRMTKPAYWGQPRIWNDRAKAAGKPAFVFCASMADVFDNQVEDGWRTQLFTIIALTPHLRWLLLTKRPQNIAKMLPVQPDGTPLPNVWLGVSVENQAEADRRIPLLLAAPAAKRFLSCEPLLGPLNLADAFNPPCQHEHAAGLDPETGYWECERCDDGEFETIDWVIAGGESGANARAMHPDWARSLRDQCQAAGVPFFMKQMTKKAEIPADLMIRERPDA